MCDAGRQCYRIDGTQKQLFSCHPVALQVHIVTRDVVVHDKATYVLQRLTDYATPQVRRRSPRGGWKM